jgi:antitoxin (DNA-binding transcriptional repressor) of toxin-antitoxin stability system
MFLLRFTMSKSTKYFELFTALKSSGANGVSPDTLQKATGFNQGALAVYIHALRHKFGAKIDSIRDGRTVVGYRLTNADELAAKILPTRKPRTVKAKAVKSKVSPLRAARVVKTTKTANKEGIVDVSDLEISEYTDNDLADIRQSLGI